MKKLIVLMFLAVSMTLSNLSHVYANDETEARSIVESVNAEWNKRFNSGDSNGVAMLYSEDATLSPGNGAILSGREEVAALFKSFIDNGVTNHEIEAMKVYQQDSQIVQLGNWKAQGTNEQGETIHFGGVLMSVLVKNSEGEWTAQSHIWNMAN